MRKISCIFLVLLCSGLAFAKDYDEVTEVANWSFSTTTEAALYTKNDFIEGDTHFSPLTGIYSGAAARFAGSATYTIPTPLGEHWLLNSANLALTATGDFTPVTIKACTEAAWTPFPFLIFAAGTQAGTGWNLFGLQGMAKLTEDETYTDLPSFKTYFLKWWAQGTFQFDIGVIFPGDWTHVQIMYIYQIYSEWLTGLNKNDIYMWQCTGNKTKGLCNYQSLILAYQLPFIVNKVGVWMELDGHYKTTDFAYEEYNGSFKALTISPLAVLAITPKDTINCVCSFASRRSFTEPHSNSGVETKLTFAGREWYFDKIGISWSHNF